MQRNRFLHYFAVASAVMAVLLPMLMPDRVYGVSAPQRIIEQAQEMNSDFYGRYPELDRDELRPITVQIAKQVAADMRVTKYSAGFGDEVAQRVKAYIAEGYGTTKPQLAGDKLKLAQKFVEDDFYGKYPELDNEIDRRMVKKLTPSVVQALDKKVWDAELRDAIAAQVKAAHAATDEMGKKYDPSKAGAIAYGTGFIVSVDGYVLTNSHVMAGCKKPYATLGKNKQAVIPIAADREADLALVKLPQGRYQSAVFRSSKVRVGEDVVVAGFPLAGLLSPELNISKGSVNALAGVHGNNKEMQISAPLQAGNSGSPVFDVSGHVVGVALANLDAKTIYKEFGSIPQNVNFAVRQEPIATLLSKHGVKTQAAESNAALPTAAIADMAAGFTVAMDCEKTI